MLSCKWAIFRPAGPTSNPYAIKMAYDLHFTLKFVHFLKAKLPPNLLITNLFYTNAIFASSPKLKRKHFKKVTPNISFLPHISVFILDPNISASRTFVLCFKGQIQM